MNQQDEKQKNTDAKASATAANVPAKNEIKEYKKLADEYLAGWKKALADFINYKKDEAKRTEEFVKFANEAMLLELIYLIDEIEIAIKKIPEELKDKHPDWVEGIINVKKKFAEFLKKNDVQKIKTSGESFDPLIHESVGEEQSGKDASPRYSSRLVPDLSERAGEADGKVAEEVRAGYTMYGKVIRPARVKIVK